MLKLIERISGGFIAEYCTRPVDRCRGSVAMLKSESNAAVLDDYLKLSLLI